MNTAFVHHKDPCWCFFLCADIETSVLLHSTAELRGLREAGPRLAADGARCRLWKVSCMEGGREAVGLIFSLLTLNPFESVCYLLLGSV